MYISKKDWLNFINSLSKIDQTASDTVVRYVQKNGFSDTDSLVRFSYDVVNTLGNASAALVAKMYDDVSALEGKFFDPAELADTPDYGEVAKTIHGALKTSKNPDEVGGAVSRLVKRTGQDTFIKNGMRDHAEFAWIPHGDTCSFCLMIAANGWQPMSKNALRNGHAEHIHKNCDCSFMIRHVPDLDVAGYKPEKYKEMFDEAEGETWEEKVNSLRRMQYAERKDVINAQKRAAYAEKNKMFHTYDDPIREKIGSAEKSHPERLNEILNDLKEKNIEVVRRENAMGYQPSPLPGKPGRVIMEPDASISAWEHELQHVKDDESLGWGGLRVFRDLEKAAQFERNAYDIEIEFAQKMGYNDVVERLQKLKQNSIRDIKNGK